MENLFLEDKLHDRIESQEFEDLFIQYEMFIGELSAKSKTFAHWSMYIQMAGKENEIVLKGTVKLSRNHVISIEEDEHFEAGIFI